MINNFFPKIRLAIKEKLDLKTASNFAEALCILTFNTAYWNSTIHISEPIPINVGVCGSFKKNLFLQDGL